MSTVYILGAGASAGFDRSYTGMRCPSAKNFFSVAGEILNKLPGRGMDDYGSLLLFLDKYYRLSPSGLESAGLDMQDVLTLMDLEIEYSDSVGEVNLLRRARSEFMDLLSATFSKVLNGPPCPYHGALASSLHPGDTVISFNYDLLIDNALYLNSPYWQPRTGYGTEAVLIKDDIDLSGKNSGEGVYLLKLHGSLNWIICNVCKRLYILPFEDQAASAAWRSTDSAVPDPGEHQPERLIVPPTIYKNLHVGVMQEVWSLALCALKNARRIVVIGYSLPAADFLVKRLLYRSLPYNTRLSEFELVDRNNSRRTNPLMAKYLPVLRRAVNPVNITCNKKDIREYACTVLPVKTNKL